MSAISLNESVIPPAVSRKQLWLIFPSCALIVGSIWAAVFSQTTFRLGTLSGYLLLQLLVVVASTDLRDRKIPNWATYTSFLLALAINLLATAASPSFDVSFLGAVGIGSSLTGGFGMLAIMLAIFSMTGGGAGDVKLTACIGALLGWQLGVDAVLFSFIIGGACVLAYSIVTNGPLYLAKAIFCSIGSTLLPRYIPRPNRSERSLLFQKLPLAPFFAAGTLLAVYREQIMFIVN